MKTIHLQPADPQRDFEQLAAWFSLLEDETSTRESLTAYYQKHLADILAATALDESDTPLGFYWASRSRVDSEQAFITLFVTPEHRRQGIGQTLYDELLRAVQSAQINKLRMVVREDAADGLAFAIKHGFNEIRHSIAMTLNLDTFDDQSYDEIINRLEREGFEFTSMAALGNTEEAQRKLYTLNNMTAMETPGTNGERSWADFADFQKSVCQSSWYRPDGQMIVIDTTSGEWIALSAITRFEGNDSAYNLHTGVDKRYRGRKIGQAVKIKALRYARKVLNVHAVQTHHNVKNLPMIAIDRKFGYVQTSGNYLMEKIL